VPAGFDSCVSRGGRVRRISGPSKKHGLGKDQYINLCFIDGKSFAGHKKTKQSKAKTERKLLG
jgi:hypothetical protein